MELVQKMCSITSHRGPDDRGTYEDNNAVLGHNRLSIIDLTTGQQPISNEDRSIWVIYNGEIYNFPEIREELQRKGHTFSTKSDTEVLVHLYEEYDESFLDKLNGIFAFALWDTRKKKLLLARDHFGVKPLYYFWNGRKLVFCSEVKGILLHKDVKREVDFQSLHYFLNLRYLPGENTLFRGIKKLLPGHYLCLEDGHVRITKYWDLVATPIRGKDEEYYTGEIRERLQAAVKRQMISDVPIGVLLSGGMDSSSIVAMMSMVSDKPVKTFSMGFGEPTDELEDAKLVARHFGTEHHEIMIQSDPLNAMAEVIWHIEEPNVRSIQGYLLSQYVSQHVKVAHSGLGGDELFAGYLNNQFIYPSQPFHNLMPEWLQSNVLSGLSSLLFRVQNRTRALRFDEYRRGLQMLLALGDKTRYYCILRNVWDYDRGNFSNIYGPKLAQSNFTLTHSLFDRYFGNSDMGFLEQVLLAELKTKLADDFLLFDDKISMAHGLEERVPFLDKELVEFAFAIPVGLKIKRNHTKYILKRAMSGLLPNEVLEKKKWGFAINPYYQFKKDLKITAERILTKERVDRQGFFNYSYIRQIIDHPPHPRMRWHYFILWVMVAFQIWHEMFIEGRFEHKDVDLNSYYS